MDPAKPGAAVDVAVLDHIKHLLAQVKSMRHQVQIAEGERLHAIAELERTRQALAETAAELAETRQALAGRTDAAR
jgi:cell division protein YceG involved in septum cleavage